MFLWKIGHIPKVRHLIRAILVYMRKHSIIFWDMIEINFYIKSQIETVYLFVESLKRTGFQYPHINVSNKLLLRIELGVLCMTFE